MTNVNSTSILDLSLPRDELEMNNCNSTDDSNFSKTDTIDLTSNANSEPQDFSSSSRSNIDQQNAAEVKRNVPLVSATALKRKGPQIEPYVPPAPQPKVRRQLPPPLVTCVSQPVQTPTKNMNVQLQLKIPSAHQAKPQQQQINAVNIATPNPQQKPMVNPMLANQPVLNPAQQNQIMQKVNLQPLNQSHQNQPQQPQRSNTFNPYNIAGVTPLFPRAAVTRPVVNLPPNNQSPSLLRPVIPANVGNVPGAQRFLVPSQRPPSRFVTNPQSPAIHGQRAPNSPQIVAPVSVQSSPGVFQPQVQTGASTSNVLEDMIPRHNNPFMAPIRKEEPLKQTRVAFKKYPEFSIVHVQQPPESSQPHPQLKTYAANLQHIMPKQQQQPRPSQPSPQVLARSIPVQSSSSAAALFNRAPNPDMQQIRAAHSQPKPVFTGSPTLNRLPHQMQIVRTGNVTQAFQPTISQQQQIAAISNQAKQLQEANFTFVPKSSPSSLILNAGQVNLVNQINQANNAKKLGNPNFQVVATPMVQSVAPQLARPGVAMPRNRPPVNPTQPLLVPPTTQSHRLATPTALSHSHNPIVTRARPEVIPVPSSTSGQQVRFFNPVVSGVKPLIPKPKPVTPLSSPIVAQQQRLSATIANHQPGNQSSKLGESHHNQLLSQQSIHISQKPSNQFMANLAVFRHQVPTSIVTSDLGSGTVPSSLSPNRQSSSSSQSTSSGPRFLNPQQHQSQKITVAPKLNVRPASANASLASNEVNSILPLPISTSQASISTVQLKNLGATISSAPGQSTATVSSNAMPPSKSRPPVAPPPPPPPLIRPLVKTISNPAKATAPSLIPPAGVTKLTDSLKRSPIGKKSQSSSAKAEKSSALSSSFKELSKQEILEVVKNATTAALAKNTSSTGPLDNATSSNEAKVNTVANLSSENNSKDDLVTSSVPTAEPKPEKSEVTSESMYQFSADDNSRDRILKTSAKTVQELMLTLDVQSHVEKLQKLSGFDWSEYLADDELSTNEKEAPQECFESIKAIRAQEMPEGAVIELRSHKDLDAWWAGAVVYSSGTRILVRYAGFSDPVDDVWLDMRTAEIHSVGWCKEQGKTLVPPPGFPPSLIMKDDCTSIHSNFLTSDERRMCSAADKFILNGTNSRQWDEQNWGKLLPRNKEPDLSVENNKNGPTSSDKCEDEMKEEDKIKFESLCNHTSVHDAKSGGSSSVSTDISKFNESKIMKIEPVMVDPDEKLCGNEVRSCKTVQDSYAKNLKLFLKRYLMGRMSVCEATIENQQFWPAEFRIPIDARFEYEYEAKKVWLVRVLSNHGGLLMLKYEGVPNDVEEHDFLVLFTSDKLHPVGFAIKSFDTIMEPPKLLSEFVTSQEEVVRTYKAGWLKQEKVKLKMPAKFFNQASTHDPTLSNESCVLNVTRLQERECYVNSKLEVVFSKLPHLVCVGTVTKVVSDNAITVELDDISMKEGKDTLSETFFLDSFNLRPALWCEQNDVELTWPLNYIPNPSIRPKNKLHPCNDFIWHDYLMQYGRRCFPKNFLKLAQQEKHQREQICSAAVTESFKIGHKMEIINPLCPRFISPCTVIKVVGNVVLVEIDGWFCDSENEKPLRIFVDAKSHSIFPARWSQSNGCPYFLIPRQTTSNDSKQESNIAATRREEHLQELKIFERPIADNYKTFSDIPSERELKLFHSNFTNKFWCPKVYVNFKCCKNPIFSRYRLSCLNQSYGPGLSIYVIRSILNCLISCSVKPFQVFREIIVICSQFDSFATSQAYIKAKFKTKNLHAFVKLPEFFSDFEEFIQMVLRKLGCCENLFTLRSFPKRVCESADCLANYKTLTAQELTDYKESDSLTNSYLNRTRGSMNRNKKRKKKKMLFSTHKRGNNQNGSDKAKNGLSLPNKKGANKTGSAINTSSAKHDDKIPSDNSLPGSRPLTPHSESPADTTDFGKLITVEPKRGFVKLKKNASVTPITTSNPPGREKSKRHKSVFSTVNMIAKNEIEFEDFMLSETCSSGVKHGDAGSSSLLSEESRFRPISPDQGSEKEQPSTSEANPQASSASSRSSTINVRNDHRNAKNQRRSLLSSPQKQSPKGPKSRQSSSDKTSSPHCSKDKSKSELTVTSIKMSTRKRTQNAQAKVPKRYTRAANPLQKSDPLKWSTEELCLHLNTTECADFLPFIRRENIDGQSFLLLNFTNLVELCEVKKELALKVCYQVAKLKKQYLHINGSKTDDSNSSGFGDV